MRLWRTTPQLASTGSDEIPLLWWACDALWEGGLDCHQGRSTRGAVGEWSSQQSPMCPRSSGVAVMPVSTEDSRRMLSEERVAVLLVLLAGLDCRGER